MGCVESQRYYACIQLVSFVTFVRSKKESLAKISRMLAYFSSAGYPILSAARRKIYDKTRDRRISSYLMDHSPLLSNRGAFLDITVGLGTVDFHKRKKERGRSLMKELKMNSL